MPNSKREELEKVTQRLLKLLDIVLKILDIARKIKATFELLSLSKVAIHFLISFIS